jgi:hypothetical protein
MKTDLQKYKQRLIEIKHRTDVITRHLQKKQSTGYLITEVEFLCLQFRKIIEEIAFLSLIANKEEYSKQYTKFEMNWNARLIFRDLEQINPSFYPEPSQQVEKKNKEGERYFEFEKITTGFMTKNDAIKIYEKCGRMMHSNNPYRNKVNIEKLYGGFPNWLNKVIKLLNHHSIVLYGKGHMVVGLMHSKDDGQPHAFDFRETAPEETKRFNEEK